MTGVQTCALPIWAEWDGVVRDVDILLTRSGDVLIGTAFLKGYIVQLDYPAHTVRIDKV